MATFVSIVILEHVLAPRLDPVRHMISEYANTNSGWLMTIGFVAWAASLALAAVIVNSQLTPRTGTVRLMATLLAIAACGLVVTAIFKTQTSGGRLPPGVRLTTRGRLHDLGSGVSTFALFGASVAGLAANQISATLRRVIGVMITAAVVADIGLLLVGASVGGLRQRLLVAIACVWQALLLRIELLEPKPLSPAD